MRAGLVATGPKAAFEAVLRLQVLRLRAPAHRRAPELQENTARAT